MPAVSAAQKRLMNAVAHSPEFAAKVDIPQSVGKEFVGKDGLDAPQMAAGTIFVSPDGAVLLLCRSAQEANYGGHWALPGGKGEAGETPWEIACREACEEIGSANRHAWIGEPTAVDEVVTPTGMVFTTFVQPVRYRFVPEIDAENCGYVWVMPSALPTPMHPQVARVLGMLFPEGAEAMEVEATSDSVAMDRATVRSKDADGHMRVGRTPITRAVVSPYLGREIPNWQGHGLEPERVYQVYRDADELMKGAKSFEGKPVLSDHIASSADNHPKLATVGAIGAPVEMVGDTLYAPLTIWDQSAIDEIESEEKRNLSCSYRYQYDPTPGTAPNGMPFDGSMKAIAGNHVALVIEPRVPGSMVADNMPAGLAATNPNSGIPVGGAKRAPAHDDEPKETAMSKANDRARDEGLMERVKGSLSAEDYKALDEMLTAGKANDEEKDDDKKASDETAQEKKDNESEAMRIKEREKAEKADDKAKDEEDDDDAADDESVSKEAMDAALKTAIDGERKHQAAIRDAERFVRPWVGDLAVAFDSAADVYKAAIEANGRSVKDVHPSAYRTILEMIPKPGQNRQQPTRLAMDAAKSNGFAERFPETGRIGISLR